jgi:hypothetical protein
MSGEPIIKASRGEKVIGDDGRENADPEEEAGGRGGE